MRGSADSVQVVGHRGWPTRFPDNTLEGIEAAIEVADMVEIDVRRSADGELVLAHDPVLGGHVVAETPWAVLGEVNLGDGYQPALLSEVLARHPGFPFNLEIKNAPAEPWFDADHRIGLEVAERARPGDLVTCFYWPTIDAVKAQHPGVWTGLLVDERGSVPDAIAHAREVGHGMVVAHWSLIDPAVCREAARYSIGIGAWTVNDDQAVRDLAAAGVTAIITDDPSRVRHILERGE